MENPFFAHYRIDLFHVPLSFSVINENKNSASFGLAAGRGNSANRQFATLEFLAHIRTSVIRQNKNNDFISLRSIYLIEIEEKQAERCSHDQIVEIKAVVNFLQLRLSRWIGGSVCMITESAEMFDIISGIRYPTRAPMSTFEQVNQPNRNGRNSHHAYNAVFL